MTDSKSVLVQCPTPRGLEVGVERWAKVLAAAPARLAYRMEFLDDSEEVFPKGKWATIQRLQDMVRKAAHADVHGVGDGKS